jgi:hypothetical protein
VSEEELLSVLRHIESAIRANTRAVEALVRFLGGVTEPEDD